MATNWIKVGRGIRYREHATRKHGTKLDRYYTIYYSIKGKDYSEGIGWSSDGTRQETCEKILMTLRANHKSGTGAQSYKDLREENLEKQKEVKAKKEYEKSLILSSLFDDYIKAQINKSESAIKSEKHLVKNHIQPYFKETSIKDINSRMLNDFLAYLQSKKSERTGKPLSAATVRYCIAVLRQIWNYALTVEIVDVAFPLRAKQPRADNRRTGFLTHDEAERLLEALKARSKDVHDISLISLYCGLRLGEIFKLQWGDINFMQGFINVRDRKNKESGIAYITIKVNEMLKSRYNNQENSDFIFSNNDGTAKQFMSKTFALTVKELGFNDGVTDSRQKIVFHSLRHTYASWLAQKGVSMFELAELLGHKDIQMTQRYSHHSPDRLRKTAMLIDEKPVKAKTIDFEKQVNEG